MKWIKKEKLYTHLMIETRLMIPETISMIQDCFRKKKYRERIKQKNFAPIFETQLRV